jgi:hypothetical protein
MFRLALYSLLLCPQIASAQDVSAELYSSLRLHLNAQEVDAAFDGGSTSELGLTDAYSRVGGRVKAQLGETEFSGTLELGINSADLEIGDPSFFEDEDFRIMSVKAKGDWGTLLVGKDWLPYYNAVGYPVDYFSSVYAGYSTYAFFREDQIAYTTPTYGGVSATVARMKRTGGGPRGWHYTASYSNEGLTFAVGREDMDNGVGDTQGASISYTSGPYYVAAKYENADGLGDIYNLFGQYSVGKWDLKAGVGLGDQFAGDSVHAGFDYKLRDNFKLFGEVYSEELNYAILRNGAESASDYFGAGGFGARQNGRVAALGFRWDVSTSQ